MLDNLTSQSPPCNTSLYTGEEPDGATRLAERLPWIFEYFSCTTTIDGTMPKSVVQYPQTQRPPPPSRMSAFLQSSTHPLTLLQSQTPASDHQLHKFHMFNVKKTSLANPKSQAWSSSQWLVALSHPQWASPKPTSTCNKHPALAFQGCPRTPCHQ